MIFPGKSPFIDGFPKNIGNCRWFFQKIVFLVPSLLVDLYGFPIGNRRIWSSPGLENRRKIGAPHVGPDCCAPSRWSSMVSKHWEILGVYIYTYEYIYVYIHICICIYYMYIYICICIYICVYVRKINNNIYVYITPILIYVDMNNYM